jgi:hypothetical protein
VGTFALAVMATSAISAESMAEEGADSGAYLEFRVEQGGEIFATRPSYVITHEDLDRFARTIPTEHRAGTFASMERVAQVVDNLSIRLGLAERAKALGYASEPELQAEMLHAVSVVLSDAYLERAREEAELDDYSYLAEEMYLNDPLRFSRDQNTVTFEQILIAPASNLEIDAMKIALEINERLEAGEEFAELIPEYSDDPQVDSNQGRYTDALVKELDPAVQEIVNVLEPGVVSHPFRSGFGWHFVRVVERKGPEQPSFEDVREQYLEAARIRHLEEVHDGILAEIVEEPIDIPDEEISRFLQRYGADQARR